MGYFPDEIYKLFIEKSKQKADQTLDEQTNVMPVKKGIFAARRIAKNRVDYEKKMFITDIECFLEENNQIFNWKKIKTNSWELYDYEDSGVAIKHKNAPILLAKYKNTWRLEQPIKSSLNQKSRNIADQIFRKLEAINDISNFKKITSNYVFFRKMLQGKAFPIKNSFSNDILYKEIAPWLETHCKGKYKFSENYIIFELENDALLFKLTWI